MKKTGVIIAALICILLVCGGYFIVKKESDRAQNNEKELTEVEKLITRDLELNYPSTPREVIKFYNRIIEVFYKEELSDNELSQLADQVLLLFDVELAEVNPKDSYLYAVRADIDRYKADSKYIAQSRVCDSNDVKYVTKDEEKLAYVDASYFVREDSSHTRTYQEYVLRQNGDGKWKILGFYQIAGMSSEEDE